MQSPLSSLKFNTASGHIWLDEERMLLLHARALGALRKELFDSLGVERTRGLLVRMGYASGMRDGAYAVKRRRAGMQTNEAFLLGPKLHAVEGVVQVEPIELSIDLARNHFYGEFLWRNSWECEADVQEYGHGEDPACWTQIGYASGYSSAFMGTPIVYKEIECRAQGDTHCRIVGQPADAWQDEAYLNYFAPHPFAGQLIEYSIGLEHLRSSSTRKPANQPLAGASAAFQAAFELLRSAAGSPITVLLQGETGVGKEVFARWLHDNGERAKGPFIAVNCGAIPADLIEAELFGVEKGAYTGAHLARSGRFERANGGTLFLDEIGDMPLAMQAKLLRALQSGEIERLGSEKSQRVDVRIVAATNVDLQKAMQDGRFRPDLYYRLNTFPITIPPLRERRADIPVLASRFLQKYGGLYGKKPGGLTDRAMQELLNHHWPGNVRELENVIERAVLLSPDGEPIEATHLFGQRLPGGDCAGRVADGGEVVEGEGGEIDLVCGDLIERNVPLGTLEQGMMRVAMQRAGGNLSKAARLLGITRAQLAYRLKREGVPV